MSGGHSSTRGRQFEWLCEGETATELAAHPECLGVGEPGYVLGGQWPVHRLGGLFQPAAVSARRLFQPLSLRGDGRQIHQWVQYDIGVAQV